MVLGSRLILWSQARCLGSRVASCLLKMFLYSWNSSGNRSRLGIGVSSRETEVLRPEVKSSDEKRKATTYKPSALAERMNATVLTSLMSMIGGVLELYEEGNGGSRGSCGEVALELEVRS